MNNLSIITLLIVTETGILSRFRKYAFIAGSAIKLGKISDELPLKLLRMTQNDTGRNYVISKWLFLSNLRIVYVSTTI